MRIKWSSRTHTVVMVLNDGDTYTDIVGCEIRVVSNEDMELVEQGRVRIGEAGYVQARAVRNIHNAWYWDSFPSA